MATINAEMPTLLDHAKMRDPKGGIAKIVEVLQRRNAFLEDAVFLEGNLPTGHRITSRTGLPSVGWRKFNEGVKSSKGRTDQFDEACGMLEGISKVDSALAKLNGNEAAFRFAQDKGFLQAMNNEVETGFVYHSTKSSPERFMGLAPRLDATAGNPAAAQIIKHDAAPAGQDQTSIWLVVWGPETVHGIYPKGSMVGLQQKDLGEDLVSDGVGGEYLALRTHWSWHLGLCVVDYRYLVRIANVDTSNLADTGNALIKSMIRATHQVQDLRSGKPVFYVNRTIGTFLHLQAVDGVKNSTLTIDNIGGQPITRLLGVPVRETDAITSTEAIVS